MKRFEASKFIFFFTFFVSFWIWFLTHVLCFWFEIGENSSKDNGDKIEKVDPDNVIPFIVMHVT
jgi:hypothetical protein